MREVKRLSEKDLQEGLTGLALLAVIGIASLPLTADFCIGGTDAGFYARQLQAGRAENLFFLLPSFLLRAGMPGEAVYKLLLFFINAASALTAYFCFRNIFSDKAVGLIGSMVYTWMPYRIGALYCRADLGEALAMTFLPLICYVLFRLFTEDTEKKSYKRVWVFAAVSYTLLFQAYLLEFLAAAGLTLLLCLAQWKKTAEKPRLLALLKTAAAFVCLNAWSAALLYYRFRAGQFPFAVTGNGKIQSRGVYLSNFLQLFFQSGSSDDVAEQGMRGLQPYGLGFAVTFGVLVYLWLRFVGRYAEKEDGRGTMRLAGIFTALGGVLALLTTNSFPWDMLQSANRLFYGLIVCLYAPVRLMSVAGVCLTVTVCAAVRQVKKWESREAGRGFLLAVAVFALAGTLYLTEDIAETGGQSSLCWEEAAEASYPLQELDISPLDYARYEGSRCELPSVFLGAEAVSAAGVVVLTVLTWRAKRAEKD